MIWFSSDSHFFHEKILTLCKRPFSSLEEMHINLINNWNSVVDDKDIIYYLGDFILENSAEARKIFSKLKGTIYYIAGNHDKWLKGYDGGYPFRTATEGGYVKILPPLHVLQEKTPIILCHYPLREWEGSYRGSWHLHGHCHGNVKSHGLSFDVGVDCWNFYPISLEQVEKKMNKIKEFESV